MSLIYKDSQSLQYVEEGGFLTGNMDLLNSANAATWFSLSQQAGCKAVCVAIICEGHEYEIQACPHLPRGLCMLS